MKLASNVNHRHQVDEENPYWISFSDIMAALLVVFILASLSLVLELVQTRADVTEAIKELAKAEEVRRNVVHEIRTELSELDIDVEISENETVIRIPDHLLSFESNKYRIPPQSIQKNTVLKIGEVLHKVIV